MGFQGVAAVELEEEASRRRARQREQRGEFSARRRQLAADLMRDLLQEKRPELPGEMTDSRRIASVGRTAV